MSGSPVTTDQLNDVQQQLLELARRFDELVETENARRLNVERLYPSRLVDPSDVRELRASFPGIPAWLSPILQGITILTLIAAAVWVGQTTGTLNTKVDNLQKSVDKLNDWKDSASVSLGSLNQKVDDIKAKVDDISKTKL